MLIISTQCNKWWW